MELIRKTLPCEIVKADRGGPITAIVSTEDVDSYGDVIIQGPNERGAGWLLDGFNKKPRTFWMHDPFRPNLALGKAWVDDDRLMFEVSFDMRDGFAAELDRKYREGFLSEWSVGFKEGVSEPREGSDYGRIFYEQTLYEISAVNMGANPETDTISKMAEHYADKLTEFNQRLAAVEAAVIAGAANDDERARIAIKSLVAKLGAVYQRTDELLAASKRR